MLSLGSYLWLAGGTAVSAICANIAYRLWTANKTESKKNSARSGSILNALRGRTRVHDDWIPDARVKGGMVFNHKKNRIEICGRLSNDSLDRVFR
jgi:hypothetical protein